jgi:hypothetical protein
MKFIIKLFPFITTLVAVAAIYASCTKGPDIKDYTYPAPEPQGLTPASGYAGTDIIITGSSFGDYKNVVKVFFNGIEADSIISCEDGKIVARVPKNGISGKVSLQVWTHIVDSVGAYTVIASPIADSVNRMAGLPGDTVIIMGSGFGTDLAKVKVSFNGPIGTVAELTDTTITAVVPAGFTAGNIVVYVNNFPVQGPTFGALAPIADPVYWLDFEGNLSDKMGGTAATYIKGLGADITYVPGVNGNAVYLPGYANPATGTNQTISCPAQISKHKELTVACWVNWANIGGRNQEPIFDFGQARGSRLCLMTRMSSSFGTGWQNMIGRLIFENIGGFTGLNAFNAVANQTLPLNSWHHVALVISTANHVEKVYLDGIEVNSKDLVATADPTLFNHNKVYIGGPAYMVANEPTYSGSIDRFQIFNYAMTPEQVFTSYYQVKK